MDIVEVARNMIREKGYISAVELASSLTAYLYQNHTMDSKKYKDVISVLDLLDNEEIHRVEYANTETEDFRRKDLFYYKPIDCKPIDCKPTKPWFVAGEDFKSGDAVTVGTDGLLHRT